MKKEKQVIQALEIQPLNDDVLANLSIEELEERLELQILHMTEAQFCYDCGQNCGTNCTSNCAQCATNNCATNCGADCASNCGSNCSTDSGCQGDFFIPM